MDNKSNNQETPNNLIKFFKDYKDVITCIAAILGLIGIYLTYQQIKETKIQIRANTSYQIHKDGREIFKTISPEIVDVITNRYPKKKYRQKIIEIAKTKINEIIMYYGSLYKQYEYENIDESSWLNISKEFCNFLNQKMVQEYWKDRIVNTKMWNQKFIDFGNSCKKKGD